MSEEQRQTELCLDLHYSSCTEVLEGNDAHEGQEEEYDVDDIYDG